MIKGREKLELWLNKKGIDFELIDTGENTSTVARSSDVLGIEKEEIVKSIVFESDKGIILAIIKGNKKINEKKLKKGTGAGWIKLAKPEKVEKYTGYRIGGVPPVGHEKEESIQYVVDEEILEREWVYAGGGDEYSQLKIRVKDIIRLLNPKILDVGR